MITTEIKKQIIEKLKEQEEIAGSRIKLCSKFDLRPDILSRLLSGETEKVLSKQRWLRLARLLDVSLENEISIVTARTETFNKIWAQLEFIKEYSVSGMLCDRADIGKSHTAKAFARENKNVVYVDCSHAKTTNSFIRTIAKGFGLEYNGLLKHVRADLYDYVRTLERPLVILDEFGDLPTSVYLEFKALWNATDHYCGYYAMGAGGLKSKIEKLIAKKAVGFEEIFSRLGNKFQRITPMDATGFEEFQTKQMVQIGKANGIKDIQGMVARSNMSLRRIPIQKGIESKRIGQN